MQNNDWLHFAERSGREGREWAEKYECHRPTAELGTRALLKMREGQLDQAKELLQEFVGKVEAVREGPASIRAVLDRYRHGIEGYYFYCRQEFSAAEKSMLLAHDAVARAINDADWLLLLAVHCQEFCMHRARIARNQHRWPRMQACIREAREMMSNGLPLCEMEDGRQIWWSNFQPFFDSLAPLNEDETRIANELLNPQERERLFDRFVRGMLRTSQNGDRRL